MSPERRDHLTEGAAAVRAKKIKLMRPYGYITCRFEERYSERKASGLTVEGINRCRVTMVLCRPADRRRSALKIQAGLDLPETGSLMFYPVRWKVIGDSTYGSASTGEE